MTYGGLWVWGLAWYRCLNNDLWGTSLIKKKSYFRERTTLINHDKKRKEKKRERGEREREREREHTIIFKHKKREKKTDHNNKFNGLFMVTTIRFNLNHRVCIYVNLFILLWQCEMDLIPWNGSSFFLLIKIFKLKEAIIRKRRKRR